MVVNFPCKICCKPVGKNHDSIQQGKCDTWVHRNCKKELDRVNGCKKRKNQTTFKAKHREATACWRESKKEKRKKVIPP